MARFHSSENLVGFVRVTTDGSRLGFEKANACLPLQAVSKVNSTQRLLSGICSDILSCLLIGR